MDAVRTALLADLAAEQQDLDDLLARLTDDDWRRPTPADGWSTADTVAHLAYFDEQVAVAASDPAASGPASAALVADLQGFVDGSLAAAPDPRAGGAARPLAGHPGRGPPPPWPPSRPAPGCPGTGRTCRRRRRSPPG